MGWCDAAECSVGLRIQLRKLVEQISEKNVEMIRQLINEGFIDDSNGFKNEVFREVVERMDWKNCDEAKDYLLETLGMRGDKFKSKFSHEVREDLSGGTLLDHFLLCHVTRLIETGRWGYYRHGTNGTFAKLPNIAKARKEVRADYKGLKGFSVVLVLRQNSG